MVSTKLKISELDAWCIITSHEKDNNIKQYAQIDLGKNMLVHGAQVRGYVDNRDTDKESVNHLAYKFRLEFSLGNGWEKIEGDKVCLKWYSYLYSVKWSMELCFTPFYNGTYTPIHICP